MAKNKPIKVPPKQRVWASVRPPVKAAIQKLVTSRVEKEGDVVAMIIERGLEALGVSVNA